MRSAECYSRGWPQEGFRPTILVAFEYVFFYFVLRGEKMGSVQCNGNMVSENRNGLSPEDVELLVLLQHSLRR